MARGAVRVEGVRELRRALTELGVEAQDFSKVNRDVGGYVGVVAAQNAPRRSGMLAASWRPGASKTEASVRFGGKALPYGNAVHWGTGPRAGLRGPHNIRRNAFAWRAAQATEPTWSGWYLDLLNSLVTKAENQAS